LRIRGTAFVTGQSGVLADVLLFRRRDLEEWFGGVEAVPMTKR
jgi:hypothetical protein